MSYSNSIILMVTGPISVISSAIIICMILRSRAKLSICYHRIMFGMSVTDIILSSGLSLSCLPAPTGTPHAWKAVGNRSTCKAQGLFIMFGMIAATTYFLSLQIYYFCMIQSQTSTQTIRQNVEPYLHITPILVGLIAAIVPLVTNSINPGSRGYCWAQDFPLHCSYQNIACIRGETTNSQRIFLLLVPMVVNILIVCIMMWKIYAAVRKQDSASNNFQSSIRRSSRNDRAQGENTICARRGTSFMTQEELHSAQYQRSRKARQRILQYFVGYFITYFFLFMDTILHNIESIDNLLEILTMIFYPLGGFFNLIVFVLPAVQKIQEQDEDLCLCRVLVLAIVSYTSPSNEEAQASRHERGAPSTARALGNPSNIEDRVTTDSSIDRIESDQASSEQ